MSVKTYNDPNSTEYVWKSDTQRSTLFRVSDVKTDSSVLKVDTSIIALMEDVFANFGSGALYCSSCYRSGDSGSQHYISTAFDIRTNGMPLRVLVERMEKSAIFKDRVLRMGLYEYTGSDMSRSHVHIDTKVEQLKWFQPNTNDSSRLYLRNGARIWDYLRDNCRTVKRGDTGEDVRYLQWFLFATPDGIFGADTEQRLINWHNARGYSGKNICDRTTWQLIMTP